MLKKIIRGLLEEEALNNPKLERSRLNTCKQCPHYNAGKMKCRICTCYMDIKTAMKVHRNPLEGMRLEITHCPLGKWEGDELKTVNYYRRLDGKEPIS